VKAWLALLCALVVSLGARAENGVTADTILIGRSAGMTGGIAARMKPATEAIEAYFAAVNAAGGVNGRKLKLLNLDDGNDAKRAAENTRKLVDEDKVFVMFANSGTAQTAAALKVLTERRVPLVGTTSGADSIQVFDPLVFHYKASYGREIAKMAEYMKSVGIARVAIVYSTDATGLEGKQLAETILMKHGISPQAQVAIKPEETAAFLKGIAKSPPQAILLTALAAPGAAFYKELASSPDRPVVFSWSVAGVEAIRQEVGDKVRGLVVSQVFPSPQSQSSRLSLEYQRLMAQAKLANGGYPGMEGYVSARLLVEGLKRAGRDLTRERLVAALRSMHDVDIGDDYVSFGPNDHVGRDFVELTIVGPDGKFLR
jgi:ABC-type branched-subunit amino acid transport system substrate-binding protein